MDRPAVLVVDDKPNLVRLLALALARCARVVPVGGVREAITALGRERFGAVLCDLKMPDGDGLAVLRAVKERGDGTPFVLMTAYASVATAVQAMREGAYDYITKPFNPDDVVTLIERALARSAVEEHTGELGLGPLLGRTAVMRDVFRTMRRVGPTGAHVLVLGEAGTGKELVAREMHASSPRRAGPLVVIDCAAVPRSLLGAETFGQARGAIVEGEWNGAFENAHAGTLLLREIGGLGLESQAMLARALERNPVSRAGETQERSADVRVLATSRFDLRAMVRAGTFREDLRLCLDVAVIDVPPLRERTDDIPLLANHFLPARDASRSAGSSSISADAMDRLVTYEWPGNVRTLRRVIERAALADDGGTIRIAALPPEIQAALARPPPSEEAIGDMAMADALELLRVEANRRYLEIVMRKFRGEVAPAADHAGIERESFYRLLRRYGLSPSSFRSDR